MSFFLSIASCARFFSAARDSFRPVTMAGSQAGACGERERRAAAFLPRAGAGGEGARAGAARFLPAFTQERLIEGAEEADEGVGEAERSYWMVDAPPPPPCARACQRAYRKGARSRSGMKVRSMFMSMLSARRGVIWRRGSVPRGGTVATAALGAGVKGWRHTISAALGLEALAQLLVHGGKPPTEVRPPPLCFLFFAQCFVPPDTMILCTRGKRPQRCARPQFVFCFQLARSRFLFQPSSLIHVLLFRCLRGGLGTRERVREGLRRWRLG